jgi:hypothetical protein
MMKVKHELMIKARCPVDGTTDEYECTVETEYLIKVEDILEKAKRFLTIENGIYQEDVCGVLAGELGGDATVTLVGTHSGVTTTVTCHAYEA